MPELHDAVRQHAAGERGGGEGGEEELRGLRAALREQRARRRSGLVVAPPLRGSLAAPCPTLYGGGGRAAGGEEGCNGFGSMEGLAFDAEVGGCRVVARRDGARAGRRSCGGCGPRYGSSVRGAGRGWWWRRRRGAASPRRARLRNPTGSASGRPAERRLAVPMGRSRVALARLHGQATAWQRGAAAAAAGTGWSSGARAEAGWGRGWMRCFRRWSR
jgi:hypothetical protein